METGRVINGRYLLQRLIKQTNYCCVYQGMDQRLQRAVAVKSVFPPSIAEYRLALKMTASFSHQHILGLYDLVIEPEALYVVQEYLEGEPFEILVKTQLQPYEIAEIGWQICLALMYAGSTSRRVCHGDLTPATLIRERQSGLIKVNDFALPTDLPYFEKWSFLGGDGVPLLETSMIPGQQSEGRKADDTRAVGLLLYQLLTSSSEPPPDGRLRFSRNTPPELCETLARAIVRAHPQYINAPEALYAQLKVLAEALEPAPLPAEEPTIRQYSPAGISLPGGVRPLREAEAGGRRLSSFSSQLPSVAATPTSSPVLSTPMATGRPAFPGQPGQSKSSPALVVLLLGLLAFGVFFACGYFLGHALIR